jgi:hypothetical protein
LSKLNKIIDRNKPTNNLRGKPKVINFKDIKKIVRKFEKPRQRQLNIYKKEKKKIPNKLKWVQRPTKKQYSKPQIKAKSGGFDKLGCSLK